MSDKTKKTEVDEKDKKNELELNTPISDFNHTINGFLDWSDDSNNYSA